MQEQENESTSRNNLDLSIFVNVPPETIGSLVEFGGFTRDQVLDLMRLCSSEVVRSVLDNVNDSTLQGFLMKKEDFQAFFEVILAALGEAELRRRATQWLIKASQAKAKDKVVSCSNIIQAIVLRKAVLLPAQQQAPIPTPQLNRPLPSASTVKGGIEHPPPPQTTNQPTQSHRLPSSPSPELQSPVAPPPAASGPRVPQPFPLDSDGNQTTPDSPISEKSPSWPRSPPHQVRQNSFPKFSSGPQDNQITPDEAIVEEGNVANGLRLGDLAQVNMPPDFDNKEVKPAATVPPVEQLVDAGDSEMLEGGDQENETEELENQEVVNPASGNPWDATINAEKVKKWNLEGAIHSNPRYTAPFRTQWMYEDRKKAMNMDDPGYKALTDQEYSRMAKVPPAIRNHAGLVYNKKSKFDWEVRVVLGKLAYDYSQMDEPENSKFLRTALVQVEARFPDLSPAHIFRKIDKEGGKAVQKWWSDVAKWVQTTAGKMSGTNSSLERHVEMLDSKKSAKKYDPYKLLGLKRAEVDYVLWGRTTKGAAACDPLIDEEMDEWKVLPASKAMIENDGRAFGQHRLKVEARIRKEEFEALPEAEQEEYRHKAKHGEILTTDEELHAAAESLLSHLVQISGQAAGIADLHIVLMASGIVSGDRLPVIIKEFGVKPEQGPFLNEQDVGGRAKAEYPAYVSLRYKADPVDLEILDKGLDDPTSSTAKSSKTNKGKGKANTCAAPQQSNGQHRESALPRVRHSFSAWAPPATITTYKKRAEYLSRFLGTTFKNNFASQLSWNAISANNNRFIEGQRRPHDDNGKPIHLMNPIAMPVDTHLAPWWEFMEQCAKGQVPDDKIFGWTPETVRLAIPSIPAPADPDVHVSGELSRTANPKKRRRGEVTSARKSQKGSRKNKPSSENPDTDLESDVEGLMEDAERWMLTEESSSRPARSRRTTNHPPPPPPVDGGDNEESDSDGSEFRPEDEERRKAGLTVYGSSLQRLRPNPLRIVSPEAMEAEMPALDTGLDDTTPPPPFHGPASKPDNARPAQELHRSASLPPAEHRQGTPSLQVAAQSTLSEAPPTYSERPHVRSAPKITPPKSSSKSPAGVKTQPAAASDIPIPLPPLPPTPLQSFTNLQIGHPHMFVEEVVAAGSPGWLQMKPLLSVWGSKIAFLNPSECDLFMSSKNPKPDIPLPSGLTASISIMQIYLAMQRPDSHIPHVPVIRVSPTCGLDNVHPHHHLRQVVEGVLDVHSPLPTTKCFEGNMLLSVEALHAFFVTLEDALNAFVDALTADEMALRYAEIEFFTALRLALYVKGTTFIRDEDGSTMSADRVNSLLDRLVSVLAAVATLRYMQEYLGGAAARWYREEEGKQSPKRDMWFAVVRLWKAGMSGLASALSQGRQDLFNYRGIADIISPSVKSVIDHLMVKPAWWSTPGNGVPLPFTVGLKQFIPSEALFDRLSKVPWPRLSYLDRLCVLLTIFICAIQLASEPETSPLLKTSVPREEESLIQQFSNACRDLMHVIESSVGTEEGPTFTRNMSDAEAHRNRTVQAWVKVWESEHGPDKPSPSATDSVAHLATAQGQNRPADQAIMASQSSSIVPATPSIAEDPDDRGPVGESERDGGLPPIVEEGEPQDGERDDLDGGAQAPKAEKKRKVVVGGRRITEASVGAAENLGRRSREVVASTVEQDPEERPRRKAHLNNPYSREAAIARPQNNDSRSPHPKASHSKKPLAVEAKVQAIGSSSAPSSSPRKLSKKQKRVQAAKKAAAAKASKKAGATSSVKASKTSKTS